MPPPNPSPGTPQDWIARADAKLALARVPLPPGGLWEDLGFFVQQAAELAIKAVYQHHGWRFPFVHDLGQRLNGLKNHGLTLPANVQRADQQSDYAVQLRLKMTTKPGEQFAIRRKAYALIKRAFDANGIKFAFPTVQVAAGGEDAQIAAARQALELTKPPPAT